MSLRVCLECRTVYAADLQACPQCDAPSRDAVYDWEDDIVKDIQPPAEKARPKVARKSKAEDK